MKNAIKHILLTVLVLGSFCLSICIFLDSTKKPSYEETRERVAKGPESAAEYFEKYPYEGRLSDELFDCIVYMNTDDSSKKFHSFTASNEKNLELKGRIFVDHLILQCLMSKNGMQ